MFPAVSGGGGGTPTVDTPSARWAEDVSAGDDIKLLTALHDDTSIDDALAYLVLMEHEDFSADDAWLQTIISANAEDTSANDLAKLSFIDIDNARSGTPDSDFMFDAYTNQLAAFAGTNFGNVSPITCRGVTTVTPGSDEQRAYIALNLTGFSGCSAGTGTITGVAFRVGLQIANSNLLTATLLTWTAYTSASRPFTESTVTWNAPPTLGSGLSNGTISVAAGGGFATYYIFFGPANLASAAGNWLLFVLTGPSAATTALVDTFSIKSRDDATAGNRPKVTIDYLQRGT